MINRIKNQVNKLIDNNLFLKKIHLFQIAVSLSYFCFTKIEH